MTDAEFIHWIADRFVYAYGESENVDFVRRLRKIAERLDVRDDESVYNQSTNMWRATNDQLPRAIKRY